jgi:hypothetical protein
MSSAVNTARTPSIARAARVSIRRIRACEIGRVLLAPGHLLAAVDARFRLRKKVGYCVAGDLHIAHAYRARRTPFPVLRECICCAISSA